MIRKLKALKSFFTTKQSDVFELESERLFFKFADTAYSFIMRLYVAFALVVVGIFIVNITA